MATKAFSVHEAKSSSGTEGLAWGASAANRPGTRPAEPAQPKAGESEKLSINARVAIAVVVLHIAVIAGLVTQRYVINKPDGPVALELLSIPAAPPPPREVPQVILESPPVIIPPPVFEIEDRPPTITAVVSDDPPRVSSPVAATLVEGPPTAAPSRAPAIVTGVDLSASMTEATPPRYPYQSRRAKEEGTVVLAVLLGLDGRVERVSIHKSSGHRRLDDAALEAVRRWRWSPRLRDGVPVAVSGLVDIPFMLKHRE